MKTNSIAFDLLSLVEKLSLKLVQFVLFGLILFVYSTFLPSRKHDYLIEFTPLLLIEVSRLEISDSI
jgi:hypothetical protein